jgi:hypothetical protein
MRDTPRATTEPRRAGKPAEWRLLLGARVRTGYDCRSGLDSFAGAGTLPMTRIALVVALVILAGGCGRDKPVAGAGQTLSEEALKQRCADPKWREANLGLWYAVCRQPVHW